jgi:hypothetical protein
MNRLAIAPMLVAGPGRMVIEEGYSLRVEGPGTDVPEQHGNGGDHDTPSNNACRAKRHVRQSTGRSPALSMTQDVPCCCYMKTSWGSCSVKRSSPYGDLHDEPEGAAPGPGWCKPRWRAASATGKARTPGNRFESS